MTTITFTGSPVRAPRLRLTPRGRAVFTALAAAPLVALALFIGLGGGDAVAGQNAPLDASAVTFEYVSIAPGQSLWQLAEQVAPQADPREVVADILALNQLQSADVQPGQELAIPVQYSN
jgi:LysM repeat protein